jgi:hypothetical protein
VIAAYLTFLLNPPMKYDKAEDASEGGSLIIVRITFSQKKHVPPGPPLRSRLLELLWRSEPSKICPSRDAFVGHTSFFAIFRRKCIIIPKRKATECTHIQHVLPRNILLLLKGSSRRFHVCVLQVFLNIKYVCHYILASPNQRTVCVHHNTANRST